MRQRQCAVAIVRWQCVTQVEDVHSFSAQDPVRFGKVRRSHHSETCLFQDQTASLNQDRIVAVDKYARRAWRRLNLGSFDPALNIGSSAETVCFLPDQAILSAYQGLLAVRKLTEQLRSLRLVAG